MKYVLSGILAVLVLTGIGYGLVRRASRAPDPVNPVTAEAPSVPVLDFSAPFSLDPLPEGWWHRRFWTRRPMEIDFVEVDGLHGLRCRTADSASIFGRFADIALETHPILTWQWRVDEPIRTDLDERTREGDDHPARLFVRFETRDGLSRSMEIIWSNGVFEPGEYKYIGSFPHYVAETSTSAVGQWVSESLDLESIYEEIWSSGEAPRLTYLAVFCDTDETNSSSEAVFTSVLMTTRDGA